MNDKIGMFLRTVVCSDGDLRLVNGSVPYEGRLEICLNEVWGTICDTNWGSTQASIACSSLGFSASGKSSFILGSTAVMLVYNISGAVGTTSSYFTAGTGPINIDSVSCTGNEDSLLDCTYSTQTTCTHSSDAGIRCSATPRKFQIKFVQIEEQQYFFSSNCCVYCQFV